MTIEEIRDLIQTVVSSGIAELEVQRGDNKVWIKRTTGVVTQEVLIPAGPTQPPVSPAAPAAAPVFFPPAPARPPAAGGGEPDLTDPSLVPVKSPIVGTFYEAASPTSPPFVKPGDHVRPGSVLCIIESMKLMNEIEAEVSGTIVKCLVENGQPVEYGETLFIVKP
jgi:acetyl-CoA carboxylase biotin carboxyl carrier protein